MTIHIILVLIVCVGCFFGFLMNLKIFSEYLKQALRYLHFNDTVDSGNLIQIFEENFPITIGRVVIDS